MGLLDDAIKEHLELKRRHGADPTEVARQEHEALGPVRRAEPPPLAPVEDPEDGALPAFDTDEHRVAEAEVEAPDDFDWDVAPPTEAAEPEAPAQRQRWEEPNDEPFAPVEPEPDEPPAARPEAAAPEPVDEPPPTVEHRIELEPPPVAEEPERDENGDVLEKTPEFLEETPEHDRLWFEQRPPRDFDFDG